MHRLDLVRRRRNYTRHSLSEEFALHKWLPTSFQHDMHRQQAHDDEHDDNTDYMATVLNDSYLDYASTDLIRRQLHPLHTCLGFYPV